MNCKYIAAVCLGVLLLFSAVSAQKTEISINLNEQFFDSLLDAVYLNSSPIEFAIAANDVVPAPTLATSFAPAEPCKQVIQLLRENSGNRSAVRFRDGKITALLAFSGNYSPPFIGCVPFAGYADANIDLQFDQNGQRLIARANVVNVSLNGTGGIGGTMIAKLLQSSIDKKINPIEIIRMDKMSFIVPIQNGGNLRMKSTGMRHEIDNGTLRIYVAYEFVKG